MPGRGGSLLNREIESEMGLSCRIGLDLPLIDLQLFFEPSRDFDKLFGPASSIVPVQDLVVMDDSIFLD